MLVVNERADAPYSEKIVAQWLRLCNVPGLAVAGGYVPGRGKRASGQEADFIVFTPNTCVCIEVKGTLSRTGGTLSCPVNGRWSMVGFEGDPVHVRGSDVNPLNQAKSAMFSLKELTASVTGAERFVSALVVVVPLNGTNVTLDKPPNRMMPKGVDILLGGRPSELFTWFQRAKFFTPVWTANRVHDMLNALSVNDSAVGLANLIAEGFAGDLTRSAVLTEGDSEPWATPSATLGPALDPWESPQAPRVYVDDYSTRGPGFAASVGSPAASEVASNRYPASNSTKVRRRGRHAPVKSFLLALAAVAALGCGIWYLLGDRSLAHQDISRQTTDLSVTQPPEPSQPPVVAPAPSKAKPMDAGSGTRPCYPFQPDC
ncbi:nuclease-related domain-containing protein [Nocardia pseudobrasiliensis]|uniref:Nuclease-like protein n=1 Tax=Nocardia pseudobrasiliensis TaxID=45979 RepID=A0A370HZZ3_9NOCA|nr:nuclease-related domain-containing protein [Nocardia pseudobrasiliensis]RDI64052.1 nuclease-like protein [Nocardia pseudobrasiliensis]